ncbi:hypothetical protein [Micromonospora sp. NPDC006431]|uniref:hypothetical protein n=1 Tax=Micromonospora sp. NPDC006431 TaxID=3364235 RepID=UPI003674AC68
MVVAPTGGHHPERVRRPAADAAGLPTRVVRAHLPADLPRLANGKARPGGGTRRRRAATDPPAPALTSSAGSTPNCSTSRRAQFWFIETLVHLVLVATALIAVPGVDGGQAVCRFPPDVVRHLQGDWHPRRAGCSSLFV